MTHRLKHSLFCLTGVSVSAILLTYLIIPIYKQTRFYENGIKTELYQSSNSVIGLNKNKEMEIFVLSKMNPKDDAIPWTSEYSTRSHINETRFKKDPWTSSSGYADFMNMPQIRYSPMFKNPCWHGSRGNGPLQDNKIHCIPYFYIIGVMKCGTTDLFQRLQLHPEVVSPGFKEAQWFGYDRTKDKFDLTKHSQIFTKKYVTFIQPSAKRRQLILKQECVNQSTAEALEDTSYQSGAKDPRRLEFYINIYDHAAERIQDSPTTLENGTITYTHVTVDASPSNLKINPQWRLLPGNENLTEPNITNLHCIKQLNPAAKIIIMLRDPVKRLYSNYLVTSKFGGNSSNYAFHERVRMSTDGFNKCLTTHTLRWCIYNKAAGKTRLDLGIYAFYLKEVWSVFDKAQVMPILLDDYHNDMRSMLQRVIDFLELRQLNRTEMDILVNHRIMNDQSYLREQAGQMLPETESLLRNFYRPYNKDMAKLMENDKYLFQ